MTSKFMLLEPWLQKERMLGRLGLCDTRERLVFRHTCNLVL